MTVQGQAEVIDEVQVEEEDLQKAAKRSTSPRLELMWWRFRKHKMALVCAVVLIVFYFVALFLRVCCAL